MKPIAIAVTVIVLMGASVAAQNSTAPIDVVRAFTEAFNKGNSAAALAACADQTSIIDEFPPHEWHGSGACTKWMTDFEADAKKNGITDAFVTLGAPKHADVNGERAYLVVPAGYTYKLKGKAMQQSGSALTVALQKAGATWRITGWSWTRGQ